MTFDTFSSLGLADKAKYYASQDFDAIPIIDLSKSSSEDKSDRQAIANAIQKACLTAGFFFVKNHGVDEDLIARAFELSKIFFEQTKSVKEEIEISLSNTFKGYSGLFRGKHAEETGPTYAGDLVEAFDLGMEKAIAADLGFDKDLDSHVDKLGHNQWPAGESWAQADEFKSVIIEYYKSVLGLGRRLLPLFALALDIDEHFFDDKTRTCNANQRMLYYPPLENAPYDPSKPGIAAHRDWQMFTILRQDQVGGLEVRNLAGEWVSATPIPGTFVINIGNQLSRWTNFVFKSNMHRVKPPPAFTPRQSSPLFWGADQNVLLSPIPSCVSEDRPFNEKVITAGEYIEYELQRVWGKK